MDIGSGDGRLLIAAARAGAQAIGLELNPFLVALSLIKIRIAKLDNQITVKWCSFRKTSVPEVDVVYIYGITSMMPYMNRFLADNFPKKTRVISYKFPIPDFKIDRCTKTGLYLYIL